MEKTLTCGEIREEIIDDAELAYLYITEFFNSFKDDYLKLPKGGIKTIDEKGKETLEKLLSGMLLLMKNPVIRNSGSKDINFDMVEGRYQEMISYFRSFKNVNVKKDYLP